MYTDPTGHFPSLMEIGIGLRIYATQLAVAASPVLYTLNHAVNRLGASQLATFLRAGVQSLNSTIYRGVGLPQSLLRLHAGQMYERVLSPAMQLIRAVPQFSIKFGGREVARADWLWRLQHIIDAKLGQSLNFGQLSHFITYAGQQGGTVTYITLTRTPPAIMQRAIDMGQARGVPVNFYSLLPF